MLSLFSPIPVIYLAYLASVSITPGRRRRAASTRQKHPAPRMATTELPLAEEDVDGNREERAMSRRICSKGERGGSKPGRFSRGRNNAGQRGGVSGDAVSAASASQSAVAFVGSVFRSYFPAVTNLSADALIKYPPPPEDNRGGGYGRSPRQGCLRSFHVPSGSLLRGGGGGGGGI